MRLLRLVKFIAFALVVLDAYWALGINNDKTAVIKEQNLNTTKLQTIQKQKYVLETGINDYNRVLTCQQNTIIDYELRILRKAFPDGIYIALFKDAGYFKSNSDLLKSYVSFNYNTYKKCGILIFIVEKSKFVQIIAYPEPKTTYYKIIPFESEILYKIKNGIEKRDTGKGISDALKFIINKHGIISSGKSSSAEIKQQAKTSAKKEVIDIQDVLPVHLDKSSSVLVFILTMIFSTILIILKMRSTKHNPEKTVVPLPLQLGVDLLYYALIVFCAYSFTILFFVTYKYLFYRILYIIFVFLVFRFIISRIRKGRNWARIACTCFIFCNLVIVLPTCISNINYVDFATAAAKLTEWSLEVIAVVVLFLPLNNRWFRNVKKKQLKEKYRRRR